jgi:hypothetical protein
MSNFDRSITIGHRWFDTIKKDYADWRFAWAREAGQNSLDAGSTRIDVSVSLNEDGDTVVTWVDNGRGMSVHTLSTAFMAVGGSDKPKDGLGGFGIAKLILAFAQKSYWMLSHDWRVNGSGAQYSVETDLPHHNGLTLSVVMEGNELAYMLGRIKRWVRFTTTKCEIYLNGIKLTSLRMHKPKRETPWCKVYTHNTITDYSYGIRVRMNKQYMFDVYTSVNAHICVDLVGTDSKKYLTSNRDGLNWSWRNKLQKLVEEIYENPNKIKEVPDHVTVYYGTDGRIDLDKRKRKAKAKVTLNTGATKVAALAGNYAPAEATQITPAISTAPRTYKEIEELIDGFDVIIVNQTNKDVPDKWLPGSMSKGSYKLLNRWIRLAQVVGGILGRTEEVSIGLVFSHEARAMYKYHDEHKHMLLLNPVNISETRFTNHWKKDAASFYEMVAAMVHEMCHIDHSNHNESFARDITYAMAKVMSKGGLLHKARMETK